MSNFNNLVQKILKETNVAGAGGAFGGSAGGTQHAIGTLGGSTASLDPAASNNDWYAQGDARVPTYLGATAKSKKKKKKNKKKKDSVEVDTLEVPVQRR